jgi:hypothetical protein
MVVEEAVARQSLSNPLAHFILERFFCATTAKSLATDPVASLVRSIKHLPVICTVQVISHQLASMCHALESCASAVPVVRWRRTHHGGDFVSFIEKVSAKLIH